MSFGTGARRRARTVVRRARMRLSRRAVILLYHRVAEVSSDPWSLAVTPRHFSEQLEVLQSFRDRLQMHSLSQALRQERLPRRSIVVTFDDGYADNLLTARPLLERFDMPATLYITTGALERPSEFWWDQLDRLILEPGERPRELDLAVGRQVHHFDLAGETALSQVDAARHRSWQAWDAPPTPRHQLYQSVYALLQPLSDSERQPALAELRAWAAAADAVPPRDRALTAQEVADLAGHELIEVGAHTVTHARLAVQPIERQRAEIQQSKRQLEDLVGAPIVSFSYPFGGPNDYGPETVAIVREAGFTSACINVSGIVRPVSDVYELPRLFVQDWDGDTFARWLTRWVG